MRSEPYRFSLNSDLAETINGLYKAEVIHRRGPWRGFKAVEFATLEWVDWFNHRRLLGDDCRIVHEIRPTAGLAAALVATVSNAAVPNAKHVIFLTRPGWAL